MRGPRTVNPAHWHVLGAGAMGCLFASRLQRAGCETTLLLRPGGAPAAVEVVVERDGNSERLELPVSTTVENGMIDHLLVTTKARDVRPAVLSVAHRLDDSSCLLLLSNGLGYASELRDRLPRPQYFHGTTTEGAYRSDDPRRERRQVCHAGRGLTSIGQPGCATPPAWFGQWAEAVRPSVWDPDIDQALWLKLAINCAINPLTARHRCHNGGLLEPDMAPRVANLCEEIMRVSAAAGFAAITAELPARVDEVIRATAGNRSSMLQDVLAGRDTEIEYITGHLLRVAREQGLSAPHNEALYRDILDRVD